MNQHKYNINLYYSGIIQNRQSMFNQHKKVESKIIFLLKSISYVSSLILKIFLSIFYKKIFFPKKLGINWTHYEYRLKEYDKNLLILNYKYKGFDKNQLKLMKYINISEVLIYFFQIKAPKHLGKINNYDNLFYRLVIASEFSIFKNLLEENQIEHLIINGLNDRYTVYFSEICHKNNIKFTIVQHGTLTKFKNCYLIHVSEFLYMYKFSKNYLKYFIHNSKNIIFLPCKREKIENNMNIYANKINISFACTPSNINLNFEIINIILNGLDEQVTLIVHPHPREKNEIYINKLKKYKNVIVTKNKYKNIKFLVTRISSLGVELKEIGIEPIFINLEEHETDYLETGNFISFTNLKKFQKWIVSESTISNWYI